MKYPCIFMCLLGASGVLASMPVKHVDTRHIKLDLTGLATRNVDMCTFCISFTEQAIQELLDIIIQGGVVGSCGVLCSALAAETTPIIGVGCEVLCAYYGVTEFVKLVERADLDPIYFCELGRLCPINDNGDASITTMQIIPVYGPQGEKDITFAYTSQNGTGTGQLDIEIVAVDGLIIGQTFIHEAAPAGKYNVSIKLNAQPDPSCDPSQGQCEQWLPGWYKVKLAICNGECGSKHPHSEIFDRCAANFEITKS